MAFKKALIEFREYPEITELFAGEPVVTIHMNIKDRKEME
jgi:hypothetical protein